MEDLINYYTNLLIIQYNGLPKATATIKEYAKLLWANELLKQIRDGFDIETATGVQLDVIGQWVGIDRYVTIKPYDNHPWLSLIEVAGATDVTLQGGYSEVDNFNTVLGGFLTPDLVIGSSTSSLSDEAFRFLIKLKIIKNSISHTCKNIDDAIYEVSDGNVWTTWDLTNHILTYNWNALWEKGTVMTVAFKKNALPCPTACTIAYNQSST